MKKTITLSTGIVIASVSILVNAKPIYPAEVMARELLIPGLGWTGHIAVTSANKIWQTDDHVLEILNEPVVGQLNTFANFKSRSKYWGSRYGVANRGDAGQHVIDEANHQRWWCPTYTSSTAYIIGAGDTKWGTRFKCGEWRCDTYTWWAFYSAGYDTVKGKIMLPTTVFNAFPIYNQSVRNTTHVLLNEGIRTLDDVTPAELNTMPFEEFEMIADIPMQQETPQHIAAEMRLANDPQLNDIKRGIFIDRLTIGGKDPDTVSKMLKLYDETDSKELKAKIIQGMMIHYQQHLDLSKNTTDQMLLKSFFATRLEEKINNQVASNVVRSFVDLHSTQEVIANMDKINDLLTKMPHESSVMLKISLASKSKEIETIYMKSLIAELKEVNSSDLDGFLFGPLVMAYKQSSKPVSQEILNPESREELIHYLKYVEYKYTDKGLRENTKDHLVRHQHLILG